MTDKFLRAPHWRLFIFSFGLPFLVQLVGTMIMISEFSGAGPATDLPSWPYYASVVSSLAVTTVWYGWTWSVGTGLQERVPREFRRSNIGFGLVLFALVIVAVAAMLTHTGELLSYDYSRGYAVVIWTLLPLFALWIAGHLYCAYYIADGLLTAETREIPARNEVTYLALLIWLFPVGIWVVQPRINKLARLQPQPASATEEPQMEPSVV